MQHVMTLPLGASQKPVWSPNKQQWQEKKTCAGPSKYGGPPAEGQLGKGGEGTKGKGSQQS